MPRWDQTLSSRLMMTTKHGAGALDEATVTNWQAILVPARQARGQQVVGWGVKGRGPSFGLREVPTPLLLTKLAMTGNPFDPEPLEDLLSRWTGHRPGSRTVDITALGQWFRAQ